MNWIDISQPLDDALAHWPEDTAFQYETAYSKKETGTVNIGRLTMSLHSGTHVDAPFHISNEGKKIGSLSLEPFIGPATVVDVSSFSSIDEQALEGLEGCRRLLFRTAIPNQPRLFPESVVPLTVEAVEILKHMGVTLIGVDAPSVDALDSKTMAVHHALNEANIQILENVMLDHVAEGHYWLAALPLPINEGDGSPVRAVIKPMEEDGNNEKR